MPVISVVKTPSYDEKILYPAVERHLAAIGAAELIRPGMRVLIKPNLLAARDPGKCVTTEPALIEAVVRSLTERGITDIKIADSPSGPFVSSALKNLYTVCGLKTPLLEPYLNYDTSWQSVQAPDGFSCRSFNIISPVCEADLIINMPRLKTHSMTYLSGAVKNLFGAVPGLQKPELHYRFPVMRDFCVMLTELARLISPQITIMDAVRIMEGNGPSGGVPRTCGFTFASRDPFSLDLFAAEMIGLPEKTVFIDCIKNGRPDTSPIDLVGDGISPFSPPLVMPDTMNDTLLGSLPPLLRKPLLVIGGHFLTPYPKIDYTNCIGCGKCSESCPPGTISIRNGKAYIARKKCITCFCCQEVCPKGAVTVRRRLNI